MVFLHTLTQSKHPFISARGVGPSLTDYLLIRAVGLPRRKVLELFFLTVPEQGSPYKCKTSRVLYQQILHLGCLPPLLPWYSLVLSTQCSPSPQNQGDSWSETLVSENPLDLSVGLCSGLGTGESDCTLDGEGLWGSRLLPTHWEHSRGWWLLERPRTGATQGQAGGSEWWSVLQAGLWEGALLSALPRFQVPWIFISSAGEKKQRGEELASAEQSQGVSVLCWFMERWGRSPCSRREYLIRATLAHREELAGSRWKGF